MIFSSLSKSCGEKEELPLKPVTVSVSCVKQGYLVIFGVVSHAFGSIVVDGGGHKDHEGRYSVFARIVIGGVLIGVLVVVILVGLLVQSLFYYVCKSYHNERIDKSALYNHLGGYLGEYYEPLKGNMQIDDSLEVEMKGGDTV